jgi:hypothetical protein
MQHVETLGKSDDQDAPQNNNYRDIASIDGPVKLRHGRLFRSSQFHSPALRKQHGIKCIIDLRKSGKQCKKWSNKGKLVLHPTWVVAKLGHLVPQKLAPRCPVCEAHANSNDVDYSVEVRSVRF